MQSKLSIGRSKQAGIGAITGDIVGSPYGSALTNIKCENFPLFSCRSEFTGVTVKTLAAAQALSECLDKTREETQEVLAARVKKYQKLYPDAGYESAIKLNLADGRTQTGPCAAACISAAGWLYEYLEDVLDYAELIAGAFQSDPASSTGAQATAAAIFLTRMGMDKPQLREFIETRFKYDLSQSLAEIRSAGAFMECGLQAAPLAIAAYLEGDAFEDVLRKAVSIGGESSAIAAIAASIAEAKYEIPDKIRKNTLERLDHPLLAALSSYEKAIKAQKRERM